MTHHDEPWPAELCQATGPAGEHCQLPNGHAGGHLAAVASAPRPVVPAATDPVPVMAPEPTLVPVMAASTPVSPPLPATPEPPPAPGDAVAAPDGPVVGSGLVYPAQVQGTDLTPPRRSTAGATALVVGISLVIVVFVTVGIYGLGSMLDAASTATARPIATAGVSFVPPSFHIDGSGSPTATDQAGATTTPSVAPTPPASAITKATAGPVPGTLRFGPLTSTSAACFRVDLADAKGKQLVGAALDLDVDVTNTVAARSANVWIGLETGQMFPGKPILVSASWSTRPISRHNDRTLMVGGPRLEPGTTHLTLHIVLQTPIDVAGQLAIGVGPDPATNRLTWAELEAAAAATWDISTAIDACP